eukprot:gene16104-14391_t
MSQMPLLNQAAMPLCSGLLFEALFARPLLAPALMQLLGPLAMWPLTTRNPAAFAYLSVRHSGKGSNPDAKDALALDGTLPGMELGTTKDLRMVDENAKGGSNHNLVP